MGTSSLTTPALPGNPDPPITITPVTKTLMVDIHSELSAAGLPTPEKIEGVTIGPQLNDGRYVLIVGTDNDISVTQTVVEIEGERLDKQYEIYTLGSEVRYTELDDTSMSFLEIVDMMSPDYLVDQGPLPEGFEPLPSYLYSFAVVPEPSSWSMLVLAVGAMGIVWRRRAGA
jgi:hypothetical protein